MLSSCVLSLQFVRSHWSDIVLSKTISLIFPKSRWISTAIAFNHAHVTIGICGRLCGTAQPLTSSAAPASDNSSGKSGAAAAWRCQATQTLPSNSVRTAQRAGSCSQAPAVPARCAALLRSLLRRSRSLKISPGHKRCALCLRGRRSASICQIGLVPPSVFLKNNRRIDGHVQEPDGTRI